MHRRFVLIARSFNAEIRAVATSAIREANNREALLARVRDELGLRKYKFAFEK